MAMEERDLAALEVGRSQARLVLEQREVAVVSRARALAPHVPLMAGPEMAAAAAQTRGVVVAEGDSWFDYPFSDVLRQLEDDHGYDVESVAHKGDAVEEMAYTGGQLDELTRTLERLLRRDVRPKAVLLSGGGNDIAGDELAMLLNHAASPVAGLNARVVEGVIDERIRTAYVTILQAVTDVCVEKLGNSLPILVHGYDHPVPDGRGFLGGWGPLPGPWLEPSLRRKGFQDPGQRLALIGSLIDRFNDMVADVASLTAFPHVHYLDLRGSLSTGPDHEDWWANEMHPTKKGFRRIADRFAAELAGLV